MEYLAQVKKGPRDPGRIAQQDQILAAESDLAHRMRSMADLAGMKVQAGEGSLDGVAVRLGIVKAMMRGVDARCPHVEWPPLATGDPILVFLSGRVAVCGRGECGSAAMSRAGDDGRCEMCDRETAHFTSNAIPLGRLMVSIEVCGECNALLQAGAGG
jgi:hypothetical protein